MTLQLLVRSFSFSLLQPLRTATGVVAKRRGWLLRLCDGDTGAVVALQNIDRSAA
jgi:O-succinylbenzoate synthase